MCRNIWIAVHVISLRVVCVFADRLSSLPVSSVCLSVTCVCVLSYVTGSPGVCPLYVVCCKYRGNIIIHPFSPLISCGSFSVSMLPCRHSSHINTHITIHRAHYQTTPSTQFLILPISTGQQMCAISFMKVLRNIILILIVVRMWILSETNQYKYEVCVCCFGTLPTLNLLELTCQCAKQVLVLPLVFIVGYWRKSSNLIIMVTLTHSFVFVVPVIFPHDWFIFASSLRFIHWIRFTE